MIVANKKQPAWQKKARKGLHRATKLVTWTIAAAQLLDFSFASLEMQDYLGTGHAFQTTALEAHQTLTNQLSLSQVELHSSVHYSPETAMSKYGYLMLKQMGGSPEKYNWGSVGYFDVSKSDKMNMCKKLKDTFTHLPTNGPTRIITFHEKMTLIHPLSTGDSFAAAESDSTLTLEEEHQLEQSGGYIGARRSLDVRLSDRIDFHSENITIGSTGTIRTQVVRNHIKSFCDGCQPMAELGIYQCVLDYTIVASHLEENSMDIEVTQAKNEVHSYHQLGLAFPTSLFGQAEFVFKVLLILLMLHMMLSTFAGSIKSHEARVFLASKDPSTRPSIAHRNYFVELLVPQHFQETTSCFPLEFIMYNSDMIVFLQSFFTLGSVFQSLAIQREVIWWNQHDHTLRSFITRLAINGRLMWIYLALFKLMKAIAIRCFGPAKCKKLVYHNNLFVILYIASLFLLDNLMGAFFSDRVDITNDPTLAVNLSVHVFNGFFIHRTPLIVVHIIVSVILTTGIVQFMDTVVLGGVSAEGTSVYDIFSGAHMSVLWDPDMAQSLTHRTGRPMLFMPIGTLMNLKWYMKYHLTTLSMNFVERHYSIETEDSSDQSSLSRAESTEAGREQLQEQLREKRRLAAESNVYCHMDENGKLMIKSINSEKSKVVVEQGLMFYKWIKTNSRIKIH